MKNSKFRGETAQKLIDKPKKVTSFLNHPNNIICYYNKHNMRMI